MRIDAIDEVGERARVAIGDEDPRTGVRERVRQLGLGPAEVERHLGSPAGRDAAVELDELDRVERQHADSIAGTGPELADHRLEAFESLEELDVGDAGVAADQRLAITRDTYRSTQGMDERVHGPSIAHRFASRLREAKRAPRGRYSQPMNASTFSACWA